jgi:hypothetical protein
MGAYHRLLILVSVALIDTPNRHRGWEEGSFYFFPLFPASSVQHLGNPIGIVEFSKSLLSQLLNLTFNG